MSSTRAAWYPRSANTSSPASRRRRRVSLPCARRSRTCPSPGPRRSRLYASLLLPETVREAAEAFGERTAYVIEPPGGTWREGFPLTYAALDRLSDEYAAGLLQRGVQIGDRVALVLAPGA